MVYWMANPFKCTDTLTLQSMEEGGRSCPENQDARRSFKPHVLNSNLTSRRAGDTDVSTQENTYNNVTQKKHNVFQAEACKPPVPGLMAK